MVNNLQASQEMISHNVDMPSFSNDEIALTLNNVRKIYQDCIKNERVIAIKDVTLDIKKEEFLCILGPSGCGKTTLLNIIAGFEDISSGKVLLQGKPIERPGPDRGVVFQDHALFPWLTVRKNIEFGLVAKNVSRYNIEKLCHHYIQLVGLNGFEDKYPHELSGGMRARVALVRVLVNEPKVLLLDEPFASLDAQTRSFMRKELLRVWEMTKQTAIFVTHDIEEALYLGDRVVLFSPRPAIISKIFDIRLSRPRDVNSIEFNRLKREISVKLGE